MAAALGDIEHATQILDAEPARIRETRPSGRRPLSAAIEAGHDEWRACFSSVAPTRTGVNPRRRRVDRCTRRRRAGKRDLVELLLACGADPNSGVDSSGNAVSAAATPEIRALLVARGGTPDPYDTSWIDDDEELRRVADIQRRPCAFRPPSRWSSGMDEGIGLNDC